MFHHILSFIDLFIIALKFILFVNLSIDSFQMLSTQSLLIRVFLMEVLLQIHQRQPLVNVNKAKSMAYLELNFSTAKFL